MPTKVSFPTQAALAKGARTVRFTCPLDCIWELRVSSAATGATRFRMHRLRPRHAGDRRLAQGPQARHRPGALLDHAHPPAEPGRTADAREQHAQPPLALATYHAGVSDEAGIRAHRGRPGGAVRLVPLLQDRSCVAPAAGRGARSGQGRVRRGGRGLGRPDGGPAGLQRLGHPPRGRLLPLADHGALRRPARARRRPQRDAARGLADDARTPTSRRRSRRSTPTRSASARAR